MARKDMERSFNFQVRVRKEMWDAASEVADSEDITVADYVRRVVRLDLENRGLKLRTLSGLTTEERVDRLAQAKSKKA